MSQNLQGTGRSARRLQRVTRKADSSERGPSHCPPLARGLPPRHIAQSMSPSGARGRGQQWAAQRGSPARHRAIAASNLEHLCPLAARFPFSAAQHRNMGPACARQAPVESLTCIPWAIRIPCQPPCTSTGLCSLLAGWRMRAGQVTGEGDDFATPGPGAARRVLAGSGKTSPLVQRPPHTHMGTFFGGRDIFRLQSVLHLTSDSRPHELPAGCPPPSSH
jgi:hypothetical protein